MAKSYHMSPEEFRRQGHAMVDWIADYQERVAELPVLSQVEPGEVRSMLPPSPPEAPEPWDQIMADVDRVVMPGITHWQSPNFFAYFPCNASGPAILGELLSAGLNVQGMLWATSPACTELETHVLDWVAELLDLPDVFRSTSSGGGVIQDSASSATLVALLAARHRVQAAGATLPQLVVYTSEHAHSSIERAARIAGIENARKVSADANFAMKAEHLKELIATDRAAGLVPTYVCATLGTTSSTAFDPVRDIGELCRADAESPIWLHVDAAMAGTAALCEEFREGHDGLVHADSYTFNPHKWMFTNFDCNCLYVAQREELIRSLSNMPEYLRNQATDSGDVIDYRDWQIPLGRRFRALKLWFTLRHYGAEGLRHHIREHVSIAQWFADQVRVHPDFELAAPAPLNLVCFRFVDGDGGDRGDEKGRALLAVLNESGAMYLSHTVLEGRYVLRLCVGQTHTTRAHVEAAWERIKATADSLPA